VRSDCYEIRGRNGPWCFLARDDTPSSGSANTIAQAHRTTTTDLLTSPTMSRARGGGVGWSSLCFLQVHLIDGTRPAIARWNSKGQYRRIAVHGDGEGKWWRGVSVASSSPGLTTFDVETVGQQVGLEEVQTPCRTTNVEETVWKWVAEPLIRLISQR
jgi:hypothetical protein